MFKKTSPSNTWILRIQIAIFFTILVVIVLTIVDFVADKYTYAHMRDECKVGYEMKISIPYDETLQLGDTVLKHESTGGFQSLSGDMNYYQAYEFYVTALNDPNKPEWAVFQCEDIHTFAFWKYDKLQEFYVNRGLKKTPEIRLP